MRRLHFALYSSTFLCAIIVGTGISWTPATSTHVSFLVADTVPGVRVQLEKAQIPDMQILYIRDTAQTTAKVSEVLGKGYGELMQYLGANKLTPQKFMAWYYTAQPPWPIDISIETNGKASTLNGRIQSRVQPGGEVIIAHVWGPYDKIGEGYKQIENWLKGNNRRAKGAPFEVYLNDPSTVNNPSEIKTDVYQPI